MISRLTPNSRFAIILPGIPCVNQGRETIAMSRHRSILTPVLFSIRRLGRIGALAAGLLVVASLVPATQASPIEYRFGGVITSAADGTGVTPGTRFEGTLTYDPRENPSSMIGTDGLATLSYGLTSNSPSSPPDQAGLSLEIGGKSIGSISGGLLVSLMQLEENQWGQIHPPQSSIGFSGSDMNLQISVGFSNPARSVLGPLGPSGPLPDPLSLADFPVSNVSVYSMTDGHPSSDVLYQGTIDTLEQVTTPEPSAVALWLGLGAAGWACRAKMRRGQ
jgi:hypothetical protein